MNEWLSIKGEREPVDYEKHVKKIMEAWKMGKQVKAVVTCDVVGIKETSLGEGCTKTELQLSVPTVQSCDYDTYFSPRLSLTVKRRSAVNIIFKTVDVPMEGVTRVEIDYGE